MQAAENKIINVASVGSHDVQSEEQENLSQQKRFVLVIIKSDLFVRCEYEDWVCVVGAVLQPVPLCAGALRCPRVAARLARLLHALAGSAQCAAHASLCAARAQRVRPPSWLAAAAPSEPLLALPHDELAQLWGDMVNHFFFPAVYSFQHSEERIHYTITISIFSLEAY